MRDKDWKAPAGRWSAIRLGAAASVICCLAFWAGFATGRKSPPSKADEKEFLTSYEAYLRKDLERMEMQVVVVQEQRLMMKLVPALAARALVSRNSVDRDLVSLLPDLAENIVDALEASNDVVDRLRNLLYDQSELIRHYGPWLEGEEDIHAGDP